MWPFRLALGPKDEYHAIRALKHHFTTDDLIVFTSILLDIIFMSDVFLKFASQAALDEIEYIEKQKNTLKKRYMRLRGDHSTSSQTWAMETIDAWSTSQM